MSCKATQYSRENICGAEIAIRLSPNSYKISYLDISKDRCGLLCCTQLCPLMESWRWVIQRSLNEMVEEDDLNDEQDHDIEENNVPGPSDADRIIYGRF